MRRLTLLALFLLAGVAVADDTSRDLTSHPKGKWGIDFADRDPSVRAADDLYRSQNGLWLSQIEVNEAHPIAAYWRDLRVLSRLRLLALIEDAAAGNSNAGTFYRSFMDEKGIEAKGLAPIQPELETIRQAKSASEIAELMGRLEGPGTTRAPSVIPRFGQALFALDIAQDSQDPSRYALYVRQAGLGLPGPEYYSDPKLADFKSAYQAYVASILSLIAWPDAPLRSAEIVAFESRVAAVSLPREQLLDVVRTHNPMTVDALARLAPQFDWRAFLRGARLSSATRVVIDAKSAFPAIARVFAGTSPQTLKARQAFALADAAAPLLSSAMVEANAKFRGGKFGGMFQTTNLPRSERAGQALEWDLPDVVGALYVAHYSSPETKAKAVEIAENVRKAFDARLAKLDWLSASTKKNARTKLASMVFHIGYPDHFVAYEGLVLDENDLYGNVARAAAWNWRRNVRRLDQPFDRSEWLLPPGRPQYAYIPTRNTVEISAAMLQPPFFDPNADDAVNYGAIGALIGQQMVSGFDNQGGRYDAEGRLSEWWTPADRKRFSEETAKLSAQYSAAEPLPGQRLKGDLFVDEALDDLGGLQSALDAYHLSLHGSPAPILDGFTGDQRVFIGRAQMWRAKFSEAFIRNQMTLGANAPPFLRVNGPARNIDAFYEAFDVGPSDKMYVAPADRVRVW